jgi:hypothetical protein
MVMELELTDTCTWLRTLGDVAGELQEFVENTDDQTAAECARSALGKIDYLKTIELDLPHMHETMINLVQREKPPDENADALRVFQEALVDVARAMIHLRRLDQDAFATTTLPPYDQWLPFKDGIGVH